MKKILEVENLSVSFNTSAGEIESIRGVSFSLYSGEILAIVGESGCGKSVLCKTIMRLLPPIARIKSGNIRTADLDIIECSERDMQRIRGNVFSMVFQDPMMSLNPTMPVGKQIAEAIRVHERKISREEIQKRVLKLMELVGFDRCEERYNLYPHNFSGGMRQRVVIAIALAAGAEILFADEPTTSLDVTIQSQILDLLSSINKKRGTSTILVSHDLGIVARAADRVAVMYAGKIIELGTTEDIFYNAKHPYTKSLLRSLPAFSEGKRLYSIPGTPPTLINPLKRDLFAPRNDYALAIDYEKEPPMFQVSDSHKAATWLLDKRASGIEMDDSRFDYTNKEKDLSYQKCEEGNKEGLKIDKYENRQNSLYDSKKVLIDIRHLTHRFKISKRSSICAVNDVSFNIHRSEIFGIVGESGSGKSTIARCIMNIYNPSEGQIIYNGINTCNSSEFRKNKRLMQTDRQFIFQDSAYSLNPRMKIADIISEPLIVRGTSISKKEARKQAEMQMSAVGLEPFFADSYPEDLSGGQRQRVAIARALIIDPGFIVADEPTASLDASVQAQIINLFHDLQRERGFAVLFISHDLALVRYLCDRVGVMYKGRFVETAHTKELFANPLHDYTKSLISAIPVPDPKKERSKPSVKSYNDSMSCGRMIEAKPEHFVYRKL
ncbi:MAG: ABC transporter ATP-binding protein [Firmicutes bacterium]|nr:ABC transporter ATP-binding protein [Bacillota bacterium]